MKRSIDPYLIQWKDNKKRKILLVRGARQVGKTYSMRQLGKTMRYYLEVNFEQDREVKDFFSGSLHPEMLFQKLSAYFNVPVISGETLVFFDEIQACPQAISALRFFYEQIPQLHVAAAGSLLDLVLEDIPSYGVGRIESVYMYPLSFDEFLEASGESALVEVKRMHEFGKPLEKAFHDKLIDYLKLFYLIGGMPEVVHEYIGSHNIQASQNILTGLIETLRDDFSKYKKHAPVQILREVFDSIALQMGAKFTYARVKNTGTHQALKQSLDMIVRAGLAYKVYHTAAQGLPLGAQIKENMFKILLFDTGIHQRILGLDMASIIAAADIEMINKGGMAELFTGLELLKNKPCNERPALYYWHKEKRAANAEIDYVIQRRADILPIEVKSGMRGKMQSLRIFLQEHPQIKRGVRVSLENFSSYENIDVCPLYAAGCLVYQHYSRRAVL